jgi:hypothetical protein
MLYRAKVQSLALCPLGVLLSLGAAHAGLGGIGNAAVNKGQLTAHWRTSYSADDESSRLDGRFRNRAMLDYGFTDDFAFGLYIQTDNPGNDNNAHDAVIAEARFELADAKTNGYYSGFRLRYTHKDGDKTPSNAHIRLIAGVPIGKWDLRINQIFAYEVGPDAKGGIGVDTRLQATHFYHPDHRVGIESFSDFGYGDRTPHFDQQNHTIGPVFAGKIEKGLFYEVGYRRGLSKAAADDTVKLFITKIF